MSGSGDEARRAGKGSDLDGGDKSIVRVKWIGIVLYCDGNVVSANTTIGVRRVAVIATKRNRSDINRPGKFQDNSWCRIAGATKPAIVVSVNPVVDSLGKVSWKANLISVGAGVEGAGREGHVAA